MATVLHGLYKLQRDATAGPLAESKAYIYPSPSGTTEIREKSDPTWNLFETPDRVRILTAFQGLSKAAQIPPPHLLTTLGSHYASHGGRASFSNHVVVPYQDLQTFLTPKDQKAQDGVLFQTARELSHISSHTEVRQIALKAMITGTLLLAPYAMPYVILYIAPYAIPYIIPYVMTLPRVVTLIPNWVSFDLLAETLSSTLIATQVALYILFQRSRTAAADLQGVHILTKHLGEKTDRRALQAALASLQNKQKQNRLSSKESWSYTASGENRLDCTSPSLASRIHRLETLLKKSTSQPVSSMRAKNRFFVYSTKSCQVDDDFLPFLWGRERLHGSVLHTASS